MEFVCVLSVKGSLVFYEVEKENNNDYKATLKTSGSVKRESLADHFDLKKKNGTWESHPDDDEIVPSLIKCIEANF